MRVAVIVNPAARKGGAQARWPAIQAELAKRLGPVEPLLARRAQTQSHEQHPTHSGCGAGEQLFKEGHRGSRSTGDGKDQTAIIGQHPIPRQRVVSR